MTALMVTVTVGSDRPGGEIQARNSLRNLDGLPRFQRMCEGYGIKPSYLITYPVLSSAKIPWFRELGERAACDLGVCLQPWTTPPFEANESRLLPTPPSVFKASAIQKKLLSLAERFTSEIGHSPRTHRAEGGGLSGACIQSLESLNFLADSSALPGIDETASGGMDWRRASPGPYHPCRQSPASRGHSPILEIPMSVGRLMPLPAGNNGFLSRLAGRRPRPLLGRSVLGLSKACRLDPGASSITEMRLVADQNIRAHLPHLVLSLRSEYLQAGESAVSGTPEQVADMFDTLDGFFRYAVDTLRAQPVTMTAYAENYLRPGQATG